jgi:osmotically-inducible protein OsmY
LALLVGMTGCATLTDSMNRRADAEVSDADLRLQQDVLNRLQQDAMTSRHAIAVDSKDGVVTLYGQVPDDMTRHRVLSVVLGTPGVVGVNDRLAR